MKNKKKTGIKQLAEYLALSPSTVSRVLNGKADDYRISKKTQQRVMRAARQMNYSPNQLARGLKIDKTETLGLIIPDIANPFFSSIAKSIEQEARKKSYSIILCDSHDNIELENHLLELLLNRKVDGIIIAPVGTEKAHLEEIYNSETPMIIIDRYFKNCPIPHVCSNNYKGAYDAITYLIANGHRNIACIQGLTGTTPTQDRVKGYLNALKKNKIPLHSDWVRGNSFSEQNGYQQSVWLLKKYPQITAIFALSNLISLGVMRGINESGRSIPDNISLISYDEQPFSALLETPMTTIEQPKTCIGKHAVSALIKQIETGKAPEKSIQLNNKLIKRKSVKKI